MDKKTVNVPSKELNITPLTAEEVQDACQISDPSSPRGLRVNQEISGGLDFIKKYPRSVTFFGSARFKEGTKYYEKARSIARKIVEKTGHTIVTGGGPGIMEGGNRGAQEGGGNSLGLGIELPTEQRINPYVTDSVLFYYFFTRKVSLAFSAEAYLFFPGGFGTLDEFFEILTLVQTRKIEKVPIILVGKDYWEPINKLIKELLYDKFKTIDKEDLGLYTVTEDEDKIVEIVKNAPLRSTD